MKKRNDVPTTEMRDHMPRYDGALVEETAPNSLTDVRISEMAFESAFRYQPDLLAMCARNTRTP